MSQDAPKKPKVETAKILTNVKFSNPQDKEAEKSIPTIYDLLCPRWKAGVLVRQPGKLTVRVDGGAYLVTIECPTEGLQTTLVVHNLVSLLPEIETTLAGGRANWVATWARRKKNLPTVDELIE